MPKRKERKKTEPKVSEARVSRILKHLPIAIASLSLAVAALSLNQSCDSNQVAKASLRVSQRAYIHLANGAIAIEGLAGAAELAKTTKRLAEGTKTPIIVGGLIVRISFDLENSGNTPAEVTDAEIEFDNHDGWIMVDYIRAGSVPGFQLGVSKTKLPALGTVGPKSTIRREYRYEVKVTPDAATQFFSPLTPRMITPRGEEGPIRLRGRLSYRDDFDENRELRWCWVSNLRAASALECNEVRDIRAVR